MRLNMQIGNEKIIPIDENEYKERKETDFTRYLENVMKSNKLQKEELKKDEEKQFYVRYGSYAVFRNMYLDEVKRIITQEAGKENYCITIEVLIQRLGAKNLTDIQQSLFVNWLDQLVFDLGIGRLGRNYYW